MALKDRLNEAAFNSVNYDDMVEVLMQIDSATVFIAEYGVTTHAEIKEALSAGKIVFCYYENSGSKYYAPIRTNNFQDLYTFSYTGFTNGVVRTNDLSCAKPANWYEHTYDAYMKPTNGIPKNDLASGVKTSLEKADGAIPNPSSKSTGQWLRYNGSSWGAYDLPKDVIIIDYNSNLSVAETAITDAIESGKYVICRLSDHTQEGDLYVPLRTWLDAIGEGYRANFSCTYEEQGHVYYLNIIVNFDNPQGWSITTYEVTVTSVSN